MQVRRDEYSIYKQYNTNSHASKTWWILNIQTIQYQQSHKYDQITNAMYKQYTNRSHASKTWYILNVQTIPYQQSRKYDQITNAMYMLIYTRFS